MKNNQNLFFSPEEKGRAFSDVLKEVQEYISSKYSTLMVEGGSEEVKQQVKRYITKYICDYRITVKGKTQEQLIDDLYTEMAEFSFLTKYIFGTGIEEIDINSWRDIEIQYNDGRCEKLEEHFESPEHAVNVIRRMLHVSGMVLDNASPAVLGHLSKENNYEALAFETVACEVTTGDNPYHSGDFHLAVAKRSEVSPLIEV